MRNRLTMAFLATLAFLGVVAAFSRCFDYGLVNLDDYCYVIRHAEVSHFNGWESIVWFFTDVSECIWMPLTWASYAIDHWLFGSWYGGFHLHSVVVHAINAVLLWRLLSLLLSCDDGKSANVCCFLAALAWAIHPLRCESVVFVASRKDVLSFFWELLALIAWVRGSQSEEEKHRILLTAASVVLFVLGALCKPSVMTFPLLCLLIDAFAVRCVHPLRYVFPALLMVGLGLFAGWQQSVGGATLAGAAEPLWARLAVAMSAFGIYLRNTVTPLWLASPCIKQWPAWPRFLLPGVVVSLVWGGFLVRRCLSIWVNRDKTLAVEFRDGYPVRLTFDMPTDFVGAGMAWFAISVAPMLGIASFGYHAFADRFTYIPSVGLALLLAFAIKSAARSCGMAVVGPVMSIVLAVLASLTWWQTGFWRHDLALFSHAIEVDGARNDFAQKGLALYYFEVEHDLEMARHHFELARETDEGTILDCVEIYALTLVGLGRQDEAHALVRQVEKFLERCFGGAKAYAIVRGKPGLNPSEIKMAISYRFARLAVELGAGTSLAEVRDELEALRDGQEVSSVWQYLMWRMLLLSGQEKAADEMLQRLLDPTTKTGYVQFRFLRSLAVRGHPAPSTCK